MRGWWPRCKSGALFFGALLLLGWLTRPLEEMAWQQLPATMPSAMPLERLEPGLGEGVLVALLGGLSSLVADMVYLQGYAYWEQKDVERTQAMLHLACELEPHCLYFWLNRAEIVGYDVAMWRIAERGSLAGVPDVVQAHLQAEAALDAIAILKRAESFHVNRFEIPLARAQLYLHRAQDMAQAAHEFKVAASMPGAPFYAQRLHAQLLYDLGDVDEAYGYLRSIFSDLPEHDPAAARPVVLARIRWLEHELSLASEQCMPLQPEEAH